MARTKPKEEKRIPIRLKAREWMDLAKAWQTNRARPDLSRYAPTLDRMAGAVTESVRGLMADENATIPVLQQSCYILAEFGQSCPQAGLIVKRIIPQLGTLVEEPEAITKG